MTVINKLISEGWFLRIGEGEDGIVGADGRWSLNAGAANILVEGNGERRIAKDELVRGRVVMVVAVDPGEGAAEVEVEAGWPERRFEVDGDGIEKGDMVFVNGSDEGRLERIQRKRKKKEEEEEELFYILRF